jgi:hypothetical protein
MDPAISAEKSVKIYQSARRHIPEDLTITYSKKDFFPMEWIQYTNFEVRYSRLIC